MAPYIVSTRTLDAYRQESMAVQGAKQEDQSPPISNTSDDDDYEGGTGRVGIRRTINIINKQYGGYAN